MEYSMRSVSRLGRYKLIKKIGCGATSDVFLASDVYLGRSVAIKILKRDILHNPDVRRRYIRELQALQKLEHPNIVSLYDADESDGFVYVVLEFVDGCTLCDKIKQHSTLCLEAKIDMLAAATSAISYIHECGMIHRDVKPQNILITKLGTVKLADFGFVKNSAGDDTVITIEGIGTPMYVAPEQAKNDRSADHRADIYSLGITAYELVSGTTPFHGNMVQQILARDKGVFVPLSSLVSDVPSRLNLLISRMIARLPCDRPSSAAAVADEFHMIIQEMKSGGGVAGSEGFAEGPESLM